MENSFFITPGAPGVISKPSVLRSERIEVSFQNELVVIMIGNTELKLHYEDAFKISQWIRVRAKQAKRFCGDQSRHWSALAVLDDLQEK